MSERAVCAWSGGKDAALSLAAERSSVERLFTTVSAATDRVTMHGVRPALIERQAAALDVPVDIIELPADPTDDEYAAVMREQLADYADRGFDRVVFADIHLDGVREYRESTLDWAGLDGTWPLWGRDTGALATEFVDRGFVATVVCVDGSRLDQSFAGRRFDEDFLTALPDDIDPCGEHGEFHTFVHDGPPLAEPVAVETGDRVTRTVRGEAFHYADLLSGE
jgi:Predicted ATPases of PP-loop superfamily